MGDKPFAVARPPGAADDGSDAEPADAAFDDSMFDLAVQTQQHEERITEPVRISQPFIVPVAIENVDPFAKINECTPEQIEKLAKILEIRGAQPRQARMRDACFNAAGVTKGMSVLEVGCGTGVVARELARMVGRKGRVVGVDVGNALLEYARGRTVRDGAAIEYVVGDAYDLKFPDRTFDASCAVTLLAHLHSIDSVVREMIRVTKNTVMLLDQDYQTLVFENSNTKITRKILQHCTDYNVLDGWCGRKLPGVLVRHGVQDVQCWPFVYSERDSASYLITIADRFAALATRNEIVTEEEGRRWLQELYDRAVEGTFFASLNYYFAFGQLRR